MGIPDLHILHRHVKPQALADARLRRGLEPTALPSKAPSNPRTRPVTRDCLPWGRPTSSCSSFAHGCHRATGSARAFPIQEKCHPEVACKAANPGAGVADVSDGWSSPSLTFLAQLGFSEREVLKIVEKVPELCTTPVETRLVPLTDYLTGLLGSGASLRKIVLRHPQTLLYSMDRKVRPVVDFLLDLGLDKGDVAAALVRFPNVLGYSVKGDLTPQVAYLVSLGIRSDEVADLVKRRPQVLGVWIEPVVRHLKMLGVKRRDIGKMLASFPIDYSVHIHTGDESIGGMGST